MSKKKGRHIGGPTNLQVVQNSLKRARRIVVLPSSFSSSMCVASRGSFPPGGTFATSPRTRRSFTKRVSAGSFGGGTGWGERDLAGAFLADGDFLPLFAVFAIKQTRQTIVRQFAARFCSQPKPQLKLMRFSTSSPSSSVTMCDLKV
jgi:hypothetical protein